MTKICMIVQKNYYHDVRVRRYVESLAKTGASVDVICLAPNQLDTEFKTPKQVRIHTIPIRSADKSRIGYILEYLFSFIWYFIRLTVLHIRNHYQVIHVHNMPDFLVFSAIIPKLMGASLILDIHDLMPEVYISKYGERSNKLIVNLIKFQEKLSCWLADEVITVNSICEKNLVNRGLSPQKITLVHNYPNPAIFDRSLYSNVTDGPKKHFTLIYPGTLAPRYGLETVIRALPQLKTRIPEIRLLVFCQETPYKDELLRLADQLGVLPHVELKPLIRNEEVPHQLIKADVGVYPAVNDVHMALATPTKVLEYAAMAIPIVSSRLRMVEETFGDSAIMFFESGNAAQFAQCVVELYRDPQLRKRLAANAYQMFVQKFSWDHEFRGYLELLRRLLPKTTMLDYVKTSKMERL